MDQLHFLQNKILKEIPILGAMGVRLHKISENESQVLVPLLANHNHKGTVFGGSLYAACTAACYSLIYSRQIQSQLQDRDLVITDGKIKYNKPVKKDFMVKALLDENDWQSLLESLKKKRPERLPMKCLIFTDQKFTEIACEFSAEFALLPSNK